MTADQNYPLFFQPGLPVSEFTVASRISRGRVYRLLDEGKLTARKLGRITHIEQSPAEFLKSLPAYQPGALPHLAKRGE